MSNTIKMSNSRGILIGKNGKLYSIALPDDLLPDDQSLLLFEETLPSDFILEFDE